MGKVVVTGGAGFIGSHICKTLLKRGDFVVCIDNLDDYYDPKIKENNISELIRNPSFKFYKKDITDYQDMEDIFHEENPEKVIHMAAKAGVRFSIEKPLLYEKVNIKGTLNLLELSVKHKIKNFIFASSSSVYGERKNVPFKETDKIDNPISPYAATKKAAELLSYTYHHLHNLNITCLRFFTVYGPSGRPDMATHKFITSILNEKPIDMYGDGTSIRDYTYVADIVNGIISALDKNLGYEIINLGGSNPIELKNFISTMEKVIGKKAIINKMSLLDGDVTKTYADIDKAKRLLGWIPKTSLEEGLRKTFEYITTNNDQK